MSRWFAIAVLIVGPPSFAGVSAAPVAAQCPMMSGSGGHDHGGGHETHAKQHTASAKKQQASADRLLADDQGRAVLMDAVLSDREFLRSLVARMIAVPEYHALLSQSLADATTPRPAAASDDPAPVYVCPMHPEVTASKPGNCPKCGMELARQTASDAPR
jgi:hypothetical protein